jgi:hypothetical protein
MRTLRRPSRKEGKFMRAIVGAIIGALIGLVTGIFFVSLIGLEPGNRVDLVVIGVVAAVFGVAGYLWGRR